MDRRRVVVTGVGLITPVGLTTDSTWSALLEGRSGVGPITKFDAAGYAARIAGEVCGLNATDFVHKKDLKKMDLHIVYALAATADAWAMSGVEGAYAEERIGTLIGSGIGGLNIMQKFHEVQLRRGPGRVSPFFIPALIVNLASGWVSMQYKLKGPNSSVCTACLHRQPRYRRCLPGDRPRRGGRHGLWGHRGRRLFAGYRRIQRMRALSLRNDEPSERAVHSTPSVTVSSWARVRASWFSRPKRRPDAVARRSSPRSSAMA